MAIPIADLEQAAAGFSLIAGGRSAHGAIVMTAAAVPAGTADVPVDLTDEPDEGWLSLYRPRGHHRRPGRGRVAPRCDQCC